jgi:tRNA(Arg) A34 adenosine deaminase TadA
MPLKLAATLALAPVMTLAHAVAQRTMTLGRHPFGAILVAPDGETVLAGQGNVDSVNHAESTLARTATSNFSPDYLWQCTLVTTVEPCAMCAGTQYWANIGRLVFGITERRLQEITGKHPDNPTMDLPSRTVLASGQKSFEIIGPVPTPTLGPQQTSQQKNATVVTGARSGFGKPRRSSWCYYFGINKPG